MNDTNREISIAIIGLGTIGRAVVHQIEAVRHSIKDRTGLDLTVKQLVEKNLDSVPPELKRYPITDNVDDVVNDPDIDIAIELIGGYEPARTIIDRLLQNGCCVVTANKAVIDKHGLELVDTAASHETRLAFSAAVGGGIPVLEAIDSGLAGNHTQSIMGILNGTTNFILSRMDRGESYDDALKTAQDAGFAEADPTFDVGGHDTAQKLAILFSILTGCKINSDRFPTGGIVGIAKEDLVFARELGFKIKLLGIIEKAADERYEIHVAPTMIPLNHPLSSVENEINAVHISGAAHITLSGEGAGGEATANAVVSDIIRLAREERLRVPYEAPFQHRPVDLTNSEHIRSEFFIKFYGLDVPGTLAAILDVLAREGVNILQAIQLEVKHGEMVPVVIMTHKTSVEHINSALDHLKEDDRFEFKLMLKVVR
jgi:homoserine dehydrogenase